MVRQYDHIVSSDLYHWLDYLIMSEDEFWRIADTFRDPKIWKIKNGNGGKITFGVKNLLMGKYILKRKEWKRYQ